jgi:hypothetical protein
VPASIISLPGCATAALFYAGVHAVALPAPDYSGYLFRLPLRIFAAWATGRASRSELCFLFSYQLLNYRLGNYQLYNYQLYNYQLYNYQLELISYSRLVLSCRSFAVLSGENHL